MPVNIEEISTPAPSQEGAFCCLCVRLVSSEI